MSTNTIVSDILAEHDARQRKQPPPTPKEAHARLIEMTNAANGLRYEVARFGDIERQLKAVHEKMEPLVLKAKELNDLICERVSQASQPWADSRIHELVQKVQQLERENAELRKDVYQCPPTSEHDYEGFKWCDACDELERENAELREDKERLAKAAQEVLESYVLHLKVDTGHPCPENMVLCRTLRTAIDAARKEGQL